MNCFRDKERILAISNIHGCFDMLEEIFKLMRYLIVLLLIFNIGCVRTDLTEKEGEINLKSNDALKQLSDEVTKNF